MYDRQFADSSSVVSLSDLNDNPDYCRMTLDELLGEDSRPSYKCSSIEDIAQEREEEFFLDRILDLQDRMAKGMAMIQEADRTRLAYIGAKMRFDRAKEFMFADDEKKPQVWWNRFNQLKAERDAAWSAYNPMRARISRLWTHWHVLREECTEMANTAIWAKYFALQNSDLNLYFTYDGDVDEQSVDSRMSPTDEIFRDSHLEEMAAYDVEVDLPVRTGGYVPPCRDVTHQYMSDEELESLYASCPF